MPFSEFGHEVRPWGLTNRRGRHVGIHPIKSRDVIIHAIAADMLASHMSGLPVCPSAARSFRCIFSENIRRTSALRSQACITSIVPRYFRHKSPRASLHSRELQTLGHTWRPLRPTFEARSSWGESKCPFTTVGNTIIMSTVHIRRGEICQ
jgi:hypothetical protein